MEAQLANRTVAIEGVEAMTKMYPPLRNQPGARALLLPRVSTAKQAEEGTSLETQEQAMRAYASERQYVVVDCLSDAFTGTDLYRPALNTARQLMRGRRIDVILIYAYDRFFRDQIYQTVFLHECRQHGVAVESVTEKQDDSSIGRMTTTMLGFVAEVEREKIINEPSEVCAHG